MILQCMPGVTDRRARERQGIRSMKPETEERSKTDGVMTMDLSDRAETRDGVLERAAKDDSSTR